MPALLTKTALTLLLAAAPLAADAAAQEFSFSSGGRGAHAGIALRFGRPTRCAPARTWVPGHYETRRERVWVAGPVRQEWVPARCEWRLDACGRRFQVLAAPGYWRTLSEPGRYEWRETQVWVPGHWRALDC